MPSIKLVGLICDDTQEARDEPFLEFEWDELNGENFHDTWGPQIMNDGDARRIDLSHSFVTTFHVELWEEDNLGNDDLLGEFTLDGTEANGRHEHTFEDRGAKYRLIYEINRPLTNQFTLYLHSLHCSDAQERTDEPYLVVNGHRVWGPVSMRSGLDSDIGQSEIFRDSALVELWESDGAKSDYIGSFEVNGATRISPPVEATFHRDRGIVGDATYILYYNVLPGP